MTMIIDIKCTSDFETPYQPLHTHSYCGHLLGGWVIVCTLRHKLQVLVPKALPRTRC